MRALTATGAAALSIWALNLSGAAGEWGTSTTAVGSSDGARVAATAAGTATSGKVHADRTASDTVGAGMLQGAILSDPQAVVPFPHAVIGSYQGEGSSALAVNAAGFGRPPAGFLMAPLEQLYASSPFGLRISPLTGAAGDFHLGQDYAAACGTKVYAADSGVVRASGWHPWGGGNRVEIDHGNGLITTYNHLDAIAVRTGDPVRAGQVIARVGTTGWSTGCHLHFETILDGRHTSPLKWGLVPTRPLDGSGTAEMRSYLPGFGSPAQGAISWALPVVHDHDEPHAAGFLPKTPATPALPPWALPPATRAAAPSAAPAAPAPDATPSSPAPPPGAPSATPPATSPTPSGTTGTPTPPAPNATPTPAEPSPSPTPGGTSPVTTPAPSGTTPTPTSSATTPAPTPTPTPATPSPSPTEPKPTTGASPSASPTEPSPSVSPTEPSPSVSPTEPSPSVSPTEPSPSVSPTEPSPSASPTEPSPSPTEPTPTAEPSPPAGTAPSPTPTEPERCPAEPTQENLTPDQYGGSLATNDAREQLPEDEACGTPVPDPADPE